MAKLAKLSTAFLSSPYPVMGNRSLRGTYRLKIFRSPILLKTTQIKKLIITNFDSGMRGMF